MKTVVKLFKRFDDAEKAMSDLGLADNQVGFLAATNAAGLPMERLHTSTVDLPGIGSVTANDRMLKLLDGHALGTRPGGILAAFEALGISKADAIGYVEGLRRGDTLEAYTVGDDAVIPVVQEEMRVGKREVETGNVRIATHIGMRPIDKTVTIREEHVEVQHRIIDRDALCGDDAFGDREIEVTAVGEVPVITKRARVVEEIRVHKDTKDRVETIRDTLRHTEVNVSDIPAFDFAPYAEHAKQFLGSGERFEAIEPAYRYGEQLSSSGESWANVEMRAKSTWETQHPGTWDRFKDAIRYATERKRAK